MDMSQGMDNMAIRKAQLEKLDAFVKTLYDECQVFNKYMNMKDLEMLYLHIHELIEEMLKCKNTDEFMAMIEDLHRAIAGILIIAVPANAGQIMQDMQESYTDFKGKDFEEMLQNLQKTSVQKYGGKSKVKDTPNQSLEDDYEEPNNDPEELIDMLDLQDHVKPKKKKETKLNIEEDPFEDIYKQFE
jgi:hypothetical protein